MKKQRKRSLLVEIAIAVFITGTLAFGACGANSSDRVLRESAVQLYLRGASTDEVARALDIDAREARRLLTTAIEDLSRAHARP